MKLKTIGSIICCFFILNVCPDISAKKDIGSLLVEMSVLQDNYYTHTVLNGQTIYSISVAYNTTPEAIYRLNPEAEKGIKPGQKLKIPMGKPKPVRYISHEIQSQETLFGISHKYNVSISDITDANVGLSESSFTIGRTIQIPVLGKTTAGESLKPSQQKVNEKYEVQKGDTFYGISKTYGITIEALLDANPILKEEGLKKGMILTIPSGNTGVNNTSENPVITTPITQNATVRLGVLLPFIDGAASMQKEKVIEYYEGLLLAVKDLKAKGLNAEIYTFDIGNENSDTRLNNLLETTEMRGLNLIIGGVTKQQITTLANYSKKRGIKYVIPFGSQNTEIKNNANVFQMINSHTNMYGKAAAEFCRRFANYNIVFVNELGTDKNKTDFIDVLAQELNANKISHQTTVGSTNLIADLAKVTNTSKKNILIPTSSSEATLKRVLVALKGSTPADVSLFGYPEWQTYTTLVPDFQKYGVYIYTSFFLNEANSDVERFAQNYKNWYNRDMMVSYPKFGCLGYDTGLYFLTALKKYGSGFDNNISTLNISTLQSAIKFDQVDSDGGYINNGLYFIHYEKGSSNIEKMDCK